MTEKIQIHPCFNKDMTGKTARIHLPLIKKCNIQCNYCNRDYSCPNENRPGVTSKLIKPEEIHSLIKNSLIIYPDLKIAGIAGPGEALAETKILHESFKIIRNNFPDLKLCLSTNGLNVLDSLDLIKKFQVDYITVTINTLNTDTASKIYRIKNIKNLISRQIQGLKELSKLEITIKINSVIIPEINFFDVMEVSRLAGNLGIFAQNLIPFIPVKGSVFENLRHPTCEEIEKIRLECSKYIKQITHCKKCRADAIGNLSMELIL